VAQLELLLKKAESGKADASAEKAKASPIVESSKPAAGRQLEAGNQRQSQEMLDYRPPKFSDASPWPTE
jgi:hypothetical protein